jgi:hypothetical protein
MIDYALGIEPEIKQARNLIYATLAKLLYLFQTPLGRAEESACLIIPLEGEVEHLLHVVIGQALCSEATISTRRFVFESRK